MVRANGKRLRLNLQNGYRPGELLFAIQVGDGSPDYHLRHAIPHSTFCAVSRYVSPTSRSRASRLLAREHRIDPLHDLRRHVDRIMNQ